MAKLERHHQPGGVFARSIHGLSGTLLERRHLSRQVERVGRPVQHGLPGGHNGPWIAAATGSDADDATPDLWIQLAPSRNPPLRFTSSRGRTTRFRGGIDLTVGTTPPCLRAHGIAVAVPFRPERSGCYRASESVPTETSRDNPSVPEVVDGPFGVDISVA